MKLSDPVTYLKGVGEKRAGYLKKLGINTVYELLNHFPRSYLDFSSPIPIKDTINEQTNIIRGTVIKKMRPSFIKNSMTVYKAVFTDGESDITIIIYNSEYLFDQLSEGKEYILSGKITGNLVKKEISSPLILHADSETKIQPVYPLTEGLNQNAVKTAVANALKIFEEAVFEPLPKNILQKHSLCALRYAFENIHFPKGHTELEIAKHRLVFDELLILQLGMLMLRTQNRSLTGHRMKKADLSGFYSQLPFELTGAQKRAISDCLIDMCREYPMNRLVQGDVGSGKTAVAAACCYFAFKNGCQSALMAPTEILASQHYLTLKTFLEPSGVRVCLLTGSLTKNQKVKLKNEIEQGDYSVIVGTHALVQKTTVFKNLGLVITDEQHRFGVEQRAVLANKGENPHRLVMSATPIPRTLALMIYGDLDVSVLDELPKGRQPVETYAVTGKLRERAFNFIKERIAEGRQGYIVCPMIDENENELHAVSDYAKKLEKGSFKGYSIGLLHGKLTPAQKDSVMSDFRDGKLQLLVSTTVVEVGVDVPNAAVMLIEDAERFGLSQLHQLRGRVGRGTHKSYCILVTENATDDAKERLKILSKTNDGFKISEEDLKLRGPGDFFGMKQHGLPQLKIADMSQDMEVLMNAQTVAREILEADSSLSSPENKWLKALVRALFEKTGETVMN